MNKGEIWEVLECCLLLSDDADLNYLEDKGFNPKLEKMGLQLYTHFTKLNIPLTP